MVAAAEPQAAAISAAAEVIRNGGVVIFPTRGGLYGLGADALNPEAVERILRIKGRDRANPILVLIDDPAMLNRVAQPVDAMIRYMMDRFWPGRVTFVVPAVTGLPEPLTGGSGKIGVRRTAHPVPAALIRSIGGPLTGTSANLSGVGGCAVVTQIDIAVRRQVDLILDAGPLSGGPGSSVVDITSTPPIILREGAVPGQEILAVFHQFATSRL